MIPGLFSDSLSLPGEDYKIVTQQGVQTAATTVDTATASAAAAAAAAAGQAAAAQQNQALIWVVLIALIFLMVND